MKQARREGRKLQSADDFIKELEAEEADDCPNEREFRVCSSQHYRHQYLYTSTG
jgi:hypothetical protein